MIDLSGALRAVAAGLLLICFALPTRLLWEGGAPWWTPFALWGFAISLLLWAALRRGNDDGGPSA